MSVELESDVSRQVRLVLEQQRADLFRLLLEKVRTLPADLCLVIFDYAEAGHRNLAFKTSFPLHLLAESFRILVATWRGSALRSPVPGLTPEILKSWGDYTEKMLPAGVGYAILVGTSVSSTAYISSGNREDMIKLIENELLPEWDSPPARTGN